jgi:hypothetical protein
MIEPECDAVAVRTPSVLKMNPRGFVSSIKRVEHEFPGES